MSESADRYRRLSAVVAPRHQLGATGRRSGF